jgi:hypothetical protein
MRDIRPAAEFESGHSRVFFGGLIALLIVLAAFLFAAA